MEEKVKHTFRWLLFIIVLIVVQNSFGQNMLFLHDKIESKDCIVRTGRNVKIETKTGTIVRGKLMQINDSSITLAGDKMTEIKLSDLKYFYYRTSTGWKTGVGVVLAMYSILMTAFIIDGISQSTNPKPNAATSDNPVPALAIVSAVTIVPLFSGTYFSLFHKKKYELQSHYNLSVIKQK